MFDVIEVYHGSTAIIECPKVDVGRENLDFGPGFYITDIYSQAESWAHRMSDERDKSAILNIYKLNRKEILERFQYKIFTAYNREWLDFVTQSRLGEKPWKNFDFLEGGVADDRVFDTIRLYMSGIIPAELALERLQYFRPANQICILNQTIANEYLHFTEAKEL